MNNLNITTEAVNKPKITINIVEFKPIDYLEEIPTSKVDNQFDYQLDDELEVISKIYYYVSTNLNM